MDDVSAQPFEPHDLDDPDEAAELAEGLASMADWQRREAAGETRYVPLDEVRRMLGLTS